jgi:hypothetical protein
VARDTIFTISDLRGGVNNSDSPTLIPATQVVDCRNVDFRDGSLGAKRRGTEAIDLTGSAFDSPVIAVFRHTPTTNPANDELWAIDENGNIDRRVGGTWFGGIPVVNDHIVIRARNYDANAVSLHAKLFIAAQGNEDRLLVFDNLVLRWAGIQQAQDPTVADTGVAGSYSGTRYFRIRYVEMNAAQTVVLRRSEPSNVVSFTPSGANTGATITKPSGTELSSSTYCEGQTHWEVEASIDNILFYRIARVAIGTSTYTDLQSYSAGYASFTLSEAIGEYVVPGSARHVAIDEDRVVMAGSYFTDALDSRVSWTPVAADDGVGNDERLPTETKQFIDFDGLDGGGVTMLVAGVAGNVYVFKALRIYKMVRTGILTSAYSPVAESFSRGATSRGACAGSDNAGLPCCYFLDQAVGLCRIGRSGVEDLARSIRETWSSRNQDALVGPRIVYYPALDQVWYTTPTGATEAIQTSDSSTLQTSDGSELHTSQTSPGLLVVFGVHESGNVFHDGLVGQAQTLALFPRSDRSIAPVIGTSTVDVTGGGESSLHFADAGTTDSGTPFRAYVRTKPYLLGDLWSKFGLMAAAVFARASTAVLQLKMIRNMGVQERDVEVNLAPAASESHVIKPVDDASLSELNAVQIEFGDEEADAQEWSVDQMVFKIRPEEGSAG